MGGSSWNVSCFAGSRGVIMKLYDVPDKTWVRVIDKEVRVPPGAPEIKEGELIYLGNIDGMFSYCENKAGDIVHMAAWTEVEIVGIETID